MPKKDRESSKSAPANSDSKTPSHAAGSASGSGAQVLADLDFVKGLIEAVDSSGIDSLEITRAGTRVKISKTPPAGGGAVYYPMPGGVAGAGGANAGSAPAGSSAPAAGAAEGAGAGGAGGASGGGASGGGAGDAGGAAAITEAESSLVDVKSPMVGTFYRAPAPEAPPYVEAGTRVTKGQTLCILEAMKLMNELESEVEGVVRQVLVENAEPVEYGQVLFRIDPSG